MTVTGEDVNGWFGVPYPDRFDDRHDEVLWGLAVTPAGVDALDASGEVGEFGDAAVLVLPCTHPVEVRAEVDDWTVAEDAEDAEALWACGSCGEERTAGEWAL